MTKNSYREHWAIEKEKYNQLSSSQKRKSKVISTLVNGACFSFGLLFLLYPTYYELQLILLLITPWLILVLVSMSNDTLHVLSFKESPFPGFTIALTACYFPVIIRVILDYTVIDYTIAWLSIIAVAPLISFVFIKALKKEFGWDEEGTIGRSILIGIVFLVVSIYTFFFTISINCTFDNSRESFYKTEVLGKRKSKGRRTTHYYVEIMVPSLIAQNKEVRISSKLWKEIEAGDSVNLEIRKGLLGIDWLELY